MTDMYFEKRAMECCSKTDPEKCKDCPYKSVVNCKKELKLDVLKGINDITNENREYKSQYSSIKMEMFELEVRTEREKENILKKFEKYIINSAKNGMISVADVSELSVKMIQELYE